MLMLFALLADGFIRKCRINRCIRFVEICQEIIVVDASIAPCVSFAEQFRDVNALKVITENLAKINRRDDPALGLIEAVKGPSQHIFVNFHSPLQGRCEELRIVDPIIIVCVEALE
mmetsp:Transcript_40073/g.115565  ORF Transcript_40073/g.115565 Transcript_40073/m.115565 type:complete len:116 (-) Transcript_40073:1264-1611(-)